MELLLLSVVHLCCILCRRHAHQMQIEIVDAEHEKGDFAIEPTEERNDAILQLRFCLFAPLDKIRGTLRKGCWSVERCCRGSLTAAYPPRDV